MDMLATSRRRPASSPLNAEIHPSNASVGSISPPHAQPPPPTDNEVMLYSIMWHRKGGHKCERKCHILCLYKPTMCFVLRLRLQKRGRGGVFAGDYITYRVSHPYSATSNNWAMQIPGYATERKAECGSWDTIVFPLLHVPSYGKLNFWSAGIITFVSWEPYNAWRRDFHRYVGMDL